MSIYQAFCLVGVFSTFYCWGVVQMLYRIPVSPRRLKLQLFFCDLGLVIGAATFVAILFRAWQHA